MFTRSPDARQSPISFVLDGQPASGCKGDSVAAALLSQGRTSFRNTLVSGAPRGPYCMMGVCFDCLVRIDGQDDQQACLVPLEEGMIVETTGGRKQG